MSDAPAVVTRYLQAASALDNTALVTCFTAVGTVLDEGRTYTGRDEIGAWREALNSTWTYTITITGSELLEDGRYQVDAHAEGDFPGGVAELRYFFVLDGDLIASLTIV